MPSARKREGSEVKKMKYNKTKKYEGKWEHKTGYHHPYGKKTQSYSKKPYTQKNY